MQGAQQTAKQIWQQDGFRGYYRGFGTVVFGTLPARVVSTAGLLPVLTLRTPWRAFSSWRQCLAASVCLAMLQPLLPMATLPASNAMSCQAHAKHKALHHLIPLHQVPAPHANHPIPPSPQSVHTS